VLHALTLCTCCHHYLGAATENTLRSFSQPYQPSPEWLPGRPARCPFRGLLGVHSHYGLHTRGIAYSDPLHRRLQPLRYLHDCSDCFRPERISRVGLSPTGKAPPYHGARHLETVTTVRFTASNFATWSSSVCQERTVSLVWPPVKNRSICSMVLKSFMFIIGFIFL